MLKSKTNNRQHGEIIGYYVVIFDRHIGREIVMPATKVDILKGKIRLP